MLFTYHVSNQPSPQAKAFWNSIIIIISSGLLCAISLNFAFGANSWIIYFGYFSHPLIFILNWIPILLFQVVLFSAINCHWIAFLVNMLFTMLPAIGNFFKLKYRNDPFSFSDVSSIMAGLSVAGDYDIQLNTRIVVATISVLLIFLALFFLAHNKAEKKDRIVAIMLVVVSIWPLWHFVYSNDILYKELAEKNLVPTTLDARQSFIDTGFPYPFIHSIKTDVEIAPPGYSVEAAQTILNNYTDEQIPDEDKVNLLVIQLESFCDLESMGLPGIRSDIYAPLHRIQEESICGTLIPNVIGGGTINTERCVLAGTNKMLEYNRPAWSYVRYFKDQGFKCIGSHPNVRYFYSRSEVMDLLGFDSFLFLDYFLPITDGAWRCDSTYLPEVFRLFQENIEDDAPVFSFNITLQGHGPYANDKYDVSGDYWSGSNVSKATDYILNNYLSSIVETQTVIERELEKLRFIPEPVVVLLYGDHKPWFGNEVYNELGISFDMSTEEGISSYLGTPYLIWANNAAKSCLSYIDNEKSVLTSPGYLMNILFQRLGWSGPAYMQFTEQIRAHIPLIYLGGRYIEDGEYTTSLRPDSEALLLNYQYLQFYLHYRP